MSSHPPMYFKNHLYWVLLAAGGLVAAAGMAGKAALGAEAAKAAVVGGMAGFLAHAINLFTGKTLIGTISGPMAVRRISESNIVSNSMTREGERVSVIQP